MRTSLRWVGLSLFVAVGLVGLQATERVEADPDDRPCAVEDERSPAGPGHGARRLVLHSQPLEIPEILGVYRTESLDSGDVVLRWEGLDGEPVEALVEAANRVRVIVVAKVEHASALALRYTYLLRSLESSEQRTASLIVETLGPVYGVKAPEGWTPGPLYVRPAIIWNDLSGVNAGLAPGQEVGGFSFESSTDRNTERYADERTGGTGYFHHRGMLPGLVRVWARGAVGTVTSPEEMPPGMGRNLPGLVDNAVVGYTVGPTEIPADMAPGDWIDRLVTHAERSQELGWVTSRGYVDRLKAELREVESAVDRGDVGRAITRLGELVERTEAGLEGGLLTSEAHALVVHTAEHLRAVLERRLPEPGVEEMQQRAGYRTGG